VETLYFFRFLALLLVCCVLYGGARILVPDFHSDVLHVVERITARSPETLLYEVTIEDPNVFTRPWQMRMPLYRRVEENAQILEFRCVEFVEDLIYGHLRKQP